MHSDLKELGGKYIALLGSRLLHQMTCEIFSNIFIDSTACTSRFVFPLSVLWLVLQTTPFADQRRVVSHCNHWMVAKECFASSGDTQKAGGCLVAVSSVVEHWHLMPRHPAWVYNSRVFGSFCFDVVVQLGNKVEPYSLPVFIHSCVLWMQTKGIRQGKPGT